VIEFDGCAPTRDRVIFFSVVHLCVRLALLNLDVHFVFKWKEPKGQKQRVWKKPSGKNSESAIEKETAL
jgi:hypothetical protein